MTGRFDRSIVESTAHRPWPMPGAPWLMTQSWNDLLFAHWQVDVAEMRRAVPNVFDPDLSMARPTDPDRWEYQLKLDGYRAIAF